MSRLTISLDDAMHQALMAATSRLGCSMGEIVERRALFGIHLNEIL